MAFDAGAIVGRIRLDTSDWSQGVGRIDKDRKRLGQGFAELGRQMESLGKKMVAVGAAGLGVGALFLRSAMHVQESESLFEVSLGGMADAARKWSNDLADSLQFNRFEIRKSVGMLNVMVKSMGFNEKAAYGMSTSLTQLAYDISSAYDITFEEAFMKLRSGIVGSIEPLLELGILTDENTYKTWAWTNGLVAQGQALSSQQKVLARYGVILDATKTAQGDAVRTAGSATNQWRALNAQAAELGATIGLSLIPDFTAFTQKANEIVKIIKEWVAVNPNLAAGITQTAVALSMVALSSGIVLLTLPTVVKSVVLLSAGIVKLSLAIWTGIPALLAFKIAVFGISAPVWVIVGLIAAIAASIYALSIAWRNNWGGMGDYLSAAVDKIANGILVPFWNWLKKHTERIVELLLSPVKRLMREVAGVSAFVGHLTEDWRDFGGAVESYKKAFAEDPFVKFRENAQKTGEVLIDALHLDEIDFQGFLAELPGTFSDYFQMVKDQVKSDLGAVAGMFSGAWDTVAAGMKARFPELSELAGKLAQASAGQTKIQAPGKLTPADSLFEAGGSGKGTEGTEGTSAGGVVESPFASMFEQLRAQTIRTVAEVKATLGDLAVSFQRSWSDNLTDAIMQTKGWRDVMRDIVKGLARQLVSTVANMVTSEVMLVAMGENAKSALYQSSGKNSIAIAVWEFAAKKAIKLKELLFERQVGERSLIMAWADSAKKVALKIWEFIAGMFASNAKFGWKGLVIAAVAGAAGTAAIMSARPSYLEGTDYVPETGMYRLHQGESVKTRTETTAAESGGSGNLTVYNLITHEAIARAMQSTAGKNTIVNIIDTDSLNNGRTRQMVRRG